MKNNKDISDLIRENQHKLNERPSPRAWEKLESKLDNHHQKSRTFLYRKLAMAAAVVALVAVISLLAVVTQSNPDKTAMRQNETPTEWGAQDLEAVYNDGNKNLRQVIEFQRELKERYANPIQEGTTTKKLLASNKKEVQSINQSPSATADVLVADNNSILIETPPSAPVTTTSSSSNQVEATEMDAGTIAMESNIMEEEIMKEKTYADASPSVEKKKRSALAKKKREAAMMAAKEKREKGIQDLKWLAGEWLNETAELKLQFLNNSELLSNQFSIRDVNGQVFFMFNDEGQIPFILKSFEGEKAVFEDKSNNRILIEKMGVAKFSIISMDKNGKVVKTRIYER